MQSLSKYRLIVAATLLFASCKGVLGIDDWAPKPTEGERCTLNTDCPTDLFCVFERCSIACRSDRDCDEGGRRCLSLDDGTSGCVTPEQVDCSTATCSGGTECRDGECRTLCSVGCRTDQLCEDGVCVGVDEPANPVGGAGGTGGKGGGGQANTAGKSGRGAGGSTTAGGASSVGGSSSGGDAGDAGAGPSAGDGGTGGVGGTSSAGGSSGASGTGGSGGVSGTSGASGTSGVGGTTPDPCVGVACEDPPGPSCEDEDTRRVHDPVGSCSDGNCTYGFTDTPCDFGCAGGACNSDPCLGVNCNAPPANDCQDSGHLVAYDSVGSCDDGDCTYSSSVIPCTCASDACVTDPCASIVCDNPPSPTCPGSFTRRTFAAVGTCSGGSCSYMPTDTPCAFGCSGGACNPDPCDGVTCNNPPAASCPSGMTLRTYEAVGSCSDGTCTYDSTNTMCTHQCSTASGAQCVCNSGYSGTGIGPSGCTDNDECTLNTDDCDTSPVAGCVNTAGSYNCPCPMPYQGTGHGSGGCTCPSVPLCDSSGEQNGSYCSSTTLLVSCASDNGCQAATSTTCTNVANEKCVGTHPNAKCELAYGFPTDGGSSGNMPTDLLFAVPFNLPQALTLSRLGLIAKAASTGVRMAIYRADGSGLGQWKASALLGTVAAGRNEYPIDDPATPPVSLTAGDYWIVAVFQATTSLAQLGAVGPVRYKSPWSPWNTAFPSPSLTTSTDSLARPNFYIVGRP
jgi:hypothetical protein